MKTWNQAAGSTVFWIFSIIRTIVFLPSETGSFAERKNHTAAHGDMSRRDEEDIEVCSKSIDLWGSIFIYYYIVACQAFFSFFLFFLILQKFGKLRVKINLRTHSSNWLSLNS
jgi:hypothetical protein